MKFMFAFFALLLSFFTHAKSYDANHTSSIKAETIIAAIDSMNPKEFAKIITENSRFKFGNFPEVKGKAGVYKAQEDFFTSVKNVKHTVHKVWRDQDSIVAQMDVTYTRHDGSKITLPVTDVFEIRNGKVDGTYIYMDIAPLYQAAKASSK
ncbi:nuclear transport factor 2 family protein [Neisseriaceae bacterium TC5R-5]|nr:nuclear transport factor 2 family protein [Neisseriaceae bacterium TC5R-5]